MSRIAIIGLAGAAALVMATRFDGAVAQAARSQTTLFTTTVTWFADPETPVLVDLRGPGGLKARGAVAADHARHAPVRLTPLGDLEAALVSPATSSWCVPVPCHP